MRTILMLIIFATSTISAVSKAVVFDYGGVLVFPDREVVANFFYKTFQLTAEEYERAKQEKKNSTDKDEVFWTNYADRKRISLPSSWKDEYLQAVQKSLGVDDAMFNLIKELKQKHIRVGLLSNMEKRWSDVARSHGLLEPFDPCLLGTEIGAKKPSQKAYEILIAMMKLDAKEIVFVDDDRENVKQAKKAGLDAILFESSSQIQKELQERDLLEKD